MLGVLFTLTNLGPGGVQSLVFSLAKGLRERGGEATIASFTPPITPYQRETLARLHGQGVNVITPAGNLGSHTSRLEFAGRALDLAQCDIVHAHVPMPHVYFGYSAWTRALPLCATFHSEVMWPERSAQLKAMLAFAVFLNRATASYIAISSTVERSMVNRYRIPPSKIVRIPNGIDVEGITQRAAGQRSYRRALRLCTDDFVLTNVARMDVRTKGQLALLEVMRVLVTLIPNAKLLLVGDGPDTPLVTRAAEPFGDSVRVLGARADVAEILGASDVFVLPSKREGLPVALLEAVAIGKPVVASPVGSVPEVIKNGENGFLVDVRDTVGYVNVLMQLASSETLRASIGSHARMTAGKFSVKRFVDDHLRLYDRIARGRERLRSR